MEKPTLKSVIDNYERKINGHENDTDKWYDNDYDMGFYNGKYEAWRVILKELREVSLSPEELLEFDYEQ